jgi:uncharacterized protein (TIGR01732 family)
VVINKGGNIMYGCYNYPVQGYNQCGTGFGGNYFALIVVLFILLIIVGAAIVR